MSKNLKCHRCQYDWESRIEGHPRNCPKCKSPLWDRPKVNRAVAGKAHGLVSAALQSGKLTKRPCCVCGEKDVQAHHEDYRKPLDVIWYCKMHHRARHAAIKGSMSRSCVVVLDTKIHTKLKKMAIRLKTTQQALVNELLSQGVEKEKNEPKKSNT